MSTKIEWAEETWNPIIGCSKVSPGCNNCYAEKMAGRLANMGNANYQKIVKTNRSLSPEPKDMPMFSSTWTGTTHFVESALEKPLKWKKPLRIFVCSMGDLFHESSEWNWITKVCRVIEKCPQHTFLFLTKRPDRMKTFFYDIVMNYHHRPFENLWLGVTAENQEMADERIPILLQIPAAKRFVSIEPMLGPVDVSDYLHDSNCNEIRRKEGACICSEPREEHLDWVICGGESGPNARPMHLDWVRYIRDQCQLAGTPFMFKQWGAFKPGTHNLKTLNHYIVLNNGDFGDYNSDYLTKRYGLVWQNMNANVMAKIGKQKAGRKLDGKVYDNYPE